LANPTRSKAKKAAPGGAAAQTFEGCSPEPAGRPLEAPGNGVSRWMVVAVPSLVKPRRWGTESGLQANSPAPPAQGRRRLLGFAHRFVEFAQRGVELGAATVGKVGLLLEQQPVGECVLAGGVRGLDLLN
jgi:hypothetical protein